ncbi:hypothetical protein [Pedobacter sp. Hv1]|uniref:hypothetical protein n=1 Tax=Pedobacter sp. Hv1 TaxID=1740090 RepID=UPI0006D8AA3A|nr:hypothetical protein [Pedobacter sp. Hv1]KQB99870.1 hypothetical protein AQF98_15260 [Pedobacter sp. Hv1]
MNKIRSLADELREAIKNDGQAVPIKKTIARKQVPKNSNRPIDHLLESILAYELNGTEKLLIRLDDRTVFLLKQLKIAGSIDMNKLIAYSLQHFLSQHPELIQYIKENIKNIEL